MSNISFMVKLLDGVEVEWKALGDIGHIVTGRTPKSSDKSAWGDEVDFVTPSDIKNGMRSITCPSRRLSAKGASSMIKAQIPSGSLLVTCIGADMGKTVINANDCITNQQINAIILTDDSVQVGYLFYVLTAMRDTLRRQGELGGGTMPLINKSDFSKIIVPIPCPDNPKKSLEIQAEIVRILDAFTAMTTELTTELSLRKKQYNYYRDQLLSFEEGEVEWKTLGEVANIKNGKDWKSLGEGNIPVYGSGGIMQHVDTFAYDKPTVLIPRKGSITNIFYVDEPFWNVDTIYYTEIDTDKITPKFFYYFMSNIDMMQLDTGSGRPSLTQAILNEIRIPLPSLAEQGRIVTILDNFDALTNSITEGLPREIELRQKQYEYYRGLLLSFPKTDNAKPDKAA